jgi:hypothetical protein
MSVAEVDHAADSNLLERRAMIGVRRLSTRRMMQVPVKVAAISDRVLPQAGAGQRRVLLTGESIARIIISLWAGLRLNFSCFRAGPIPGSGCSKNSLDLDHQQGNDAFADTVQIAGCDSSIEGLTSDCIDLQMFDKLLGKGKAAQVTESLWAMNSKQQTTMLVTTQLDIAMGLPFNINSHRRYTPKTYPIQQSFRLISCVQFLQEDAVDVRGQRARYRRQYRAFSPDAARHLSDQYPTFSRNTQ